MNFFDLMSPSDKMFSTQVNKTVKLKPGGKAVVTIVTSYICVYRSYITQLENDLVKVITKVEKNYQAPYQYTSYFCSVTGNEITSNQFKLIK